MCVSSCRCRRVLMSRLGLARSVFHSDWFHVCYEPCRASTPLTLLWRFSKLSIYSVLSLLGFLCALNTFRVCGYLEFVPYVEFCLGGRNSGAADKWS